ncbi:Glycine oxidase [Roseibium album]|nr:Glycine oxidase [Roseibium album]
MRVLIRGAGVAGMSLGYELTRRGAEVTIADISNGLSGNASWLAGGMLAPWCERENAEEKVLTLGRKSIDWWTELAPGLVTHHGTVVVAPPRDLSELSRFAGRTSGYEWLDGEELASLEPDLEGRFSKALFFRQEAHLDPRHALTRLKEKLEMLGVQFVFSSNTATVDADIEADCTGMASNNAELRGVRGEMMILQTSEVALSRPVRMLHPRIPVYIVPRENNHFMVGATMIESDDDGPISVRSTMELLNAAYSLHPAFAEAKIVETGTGVRAAYFDNLPRVTVAGRKISMNGFYRHGFLLSPHFASEAADRIFEALQEKDFETHN